MDEAPFVIRDDDRTGVLRATVRGFWSVAVVEDYVTALHSRIDRLRRNGEPVRLIIDASTLPTQSASVGERFVSDWTRLLTGPDDRAAMILGSPLAAMQARRLCASERCHVFAEAAEAEDWVAGR